VGSRSLKSGNEDQLKKEVKRREDRLKRNPAYHPDLRLLSKLVSIVVHAEELLSSSGHEFDKVQLDQLLADADVKRWVSQMGPLAPQKRSST